MRSFGSGGVKLVFPRVLCIMCLAAFSGCKESEPSGPVSNPRPSISQLSPTFVEFESPGLVVTVHGTGFVPSSRIRIDNRDKATTYVNESTLSIVVDESELLTPRRVNLTVHNPEPGGGASNSSTFSVTLPIPEILSVEPESVVTSQDVVEFVVSATGLLDGSQVTFDGAGVPWERIDGQRIRASVDFANPPSAGMKLLKIENFGVGGGADATTILLLNPVATIRNVFPETPVAERLQTISILGSGFNAQSRLLWDETSIPSRYVNPGLIEAEFVPTAGTHSVSVFAPGPGGGLAQAIEVGVADMAPQIESVTPDVRTTGSADFTLTIRGQGFIPSSTAVLRGTDRGTQFVDDRTLRVTVSSTEVLSSGAISVVVRNPDGQQSGTVSIAVVDPGAFSPTRTLSVELRSRDIVFDPVRSLFYVTVPRDDLIFGDEVVAIDASSGEIVKRRFVGHDPNRVVITDDASRIYVASLRESVVTEIDLRTFAPTRQFKIGADPSGVEYFPQDIEVVPGDPSMLIVGLGHPCCTTPHEGLAVFRSGVRSLIRFGGPGTASETTALNSQGVFYGFNGESTEFGLRRLLLTDAGIVENEVKAGFFGAFNTRIEVSGDWIFSTLGDLVDGRTLTQVGKFSSGGFGALVEPDVPNGRVHFFNGFEVATHGAWTTSLIGTMRVGGAGGSQTMIRWGSAGLAFAGGSRVVIIESPLVGGD